MKKILFVICLFLVVPFSAYGEEKIELAKEIMELTNMEKMMDQLKEQVFQLQNQLVSQLNIPEDKKEETLEFQKKLTAKIFEIMDFDNLENEYVNLFTSVYTIEELEGIINFYKSSVGKSMLEKQPLIVKKAMEISQNKLKELIPEFQKMSREFELSLKE